MQEEMSLRKRYRSMQEHTRRTHRNYYIPMLPATQESFQLMTNIQSARPEDVVVIPDDAGDTHNAQGPQSWVLTAASKRCTHATMPTSQLIAEAIARLSELDQTQAVEDGHWLWNQQSM